MMNRRILAVCAITTMILMLMTPFFATECFAQVDKVNVKFDIPKNFKTPAKIKEALDEEDRYYSEITPSYSYDYSVNPNLIGEYRITSGGEDVYGYSAIVNQKMKYTDNEPEIKTIGSYEVRYESRPEENYTEEAKSESTFNEFFYYRLISEGNYISDVKLKEDDCKKKSSDYSTKSIDIKGCDKAYEYQSGSESENEGTIFDFSKSYTLYVEDKELFDSTGCILEINYGYSATVSYTAPSLMTNDYYQGVFNSLTSTAKADFKSMIAKGEGGLPSSLSDVVITIREGSGDESIAVNDGGGSVTINTDASSSKGESSVSIPTTIVTSVLCTVVAAGAAGAVGAASAAAGAGAASSAAGASNQTGDISEEKKKSSYKMYIQKNFGNYIRYNKSQVTVYARIAEITPEGTEVDRPDMTKQIKITNGGNLDVENAVMTGNYMGALVSCTREVGVENPTSGIVSFSYTGEGGTFKNNMSFRLIGDADIWLERSECELLAGNADTVRIPFTLVDFSTYDDLVVTTELGKEDCPVLASLDMKDSESGELVLFDRGVLPPDNSDKPYLRYSGKIIAKNGDEEVKRDFHISWCMEGLFVEFRDEQNFAIEDKNIPCMCKSETDKTMKRTWIGLRDAKWNDTEKRMEYIPAEDAEIVIKSSRIIENLGWKFEPATDWGDKEYTGIWMTPIKPLFSDEKFEAKLSVTVGEVSKETEFFVVPNIINYYNSRDKQYKHLTSMCIECFSGEALDVMLNRAAELFAKGSLEDMQSYTRFIWKQAKLVLEERQEAAIQTCENYDTIIAALEFAVWLGDMATEALKTLTLGPIAGIALDVSKEVFIECGKIYFNDKSENLEEVSSAIISATVKGLVGNVDSLYDFPEPPNWKKVLCWATIYYFYKVFYHWMYDKDANGESIGLYESLKLASADLLLKSALNLGLKKCMKSMRQRDKLLNRVDEAIGESGKIKTSTFMDKLDDMGYSSDADEKVFKEARSTVVDKLSEWILELQKMLNAGYQISGNTLNI